MPEGFDLNSVLDKVKDKVLAPAQPEPRWSIWEQGQRPQAPRPGAGPEMPQNFPRPEINQIPQLRPEQMQGTKQADENTKKAVYQLISEAQRQSYRSESAKRYSHAVDIANNSQDASLQALAKVEYGLAHMSWGSAEQGFKWILEAGSNNPSIYDSRTNQSFLQRLAQVGMPQSAVDMLMKNGAQDPNWHYRDQDAAKKLDKAMTGTAFVPPAQGMRPGQERVDPLAPPIDRRPENLNPNLDPPAQAGAWMKEQVNHALTQAQQQKNASDAFAYLKQSVDLADRSRDPGLRALTRVETGLALLTWGHTENAFKWLLDAGSINKGLYDSRYNSGYLNRLGQAGIPKQVMDIMMDNGQRDPNWHKKSPDAARMLESVLKNPQAPARSDSIIPMPSLPGFSPFEQAPKPQPSLPEQVPPSQLPKPQPKFEYTPRKSPFD